MDLGAGLGEGVLGEVRQVAPKQEFSILADVELGGFFVFTNGHINVGFLQTFDRRFFQGPDDNLDIRTEGIQMPQIRFDVFLCLRRRSRGCRRGLGLLRGHSESKRA